MKKLVLSYSKCKTYDCPKKYYYQYVQRAPKVDNQRHTLPGRVIQKLFELYINTHHFQDGSKWLYSNITDIFYQELNKYIKTTKFYAGETPESVLDEITDMIPNCYDLFLKKGWNRAKVRSEVSLQMPLFDGVYVTGTLDFIIETNNGVYVLDFKATSHGLKALDKEQLIIYAMLYRHHHNKYPDGLYFYLTRDNQLAQVKITDELINDLKLRLKAVADGILDQNYEKKPSKDNCRYCPYKRICWKPDKCPF